MVHLILDINFGFQALKFLFFYQINIVNIILRILFFSLSILKDPCVYLYYTLV